MLIKPTIHVKLAENNKPACKMAPWCGTSLDADQLASGLVAEIDTYPRTHPGRGAKLIGGSRRASYRPVPFVAINVQGVVQTYNVSFSLKGYQPQSVPMRMTVNEPNSMQSGYAGPAPTTVITPDAVTAELVPMKSTAARTKAKATTITASSAPPLPSSSPPAPGSPTMPAALTTTER